jgi:hypothetical protein
MKEKVSLVRLAMKLLLHPFPTSKELLLNIALYPNSNQLQNQKHSLMNKVNYHFQKKPREKKSNNNNNNNNLFNPNSNVISYIW